MIHILIHTILDLLKIVPFFFIAFLIMELLEPFVIQNPNVTQEFLIVYVKTAQR